MGATTPLVEGFELDTIVNDNGSSSGVHIRDVVGADALGLVDDAPAGNSVLGRLKTIADRLTTMAGYVDGLEALATTLNGLVDGLETLGGTTNTSLTNLAGFVDGLEGLATTLNSYVDGLEAATATIGTRSYNYGAGLILTADTDGNRTAAGITATEVLVHARGGAAAIKAGDVTVLASTDGKSIPLEDGEKFHLRITTGQYISAIRLGGADVSLTIVPVN